MKSMNATALARFGKEASSDPTSFLMLGKALIDLNGLNTLNVRRAFNSRAGILQSSIKPDTTTTKSKLFQGSLKYEFLCTTKPIAMILTTASSVNMTVNTLPQVSRPALGALPGGVSGE